MMVPYFGAAPVGERTAAKEQPDMKTERRKDAARLGAGGRP